MSTERKQVVPEGAALSRPALAGVDHLKSIDPELNKAAQTVLGALRQDMLPIDVQEELFRSLNPGVQRSMIAEVAGLDSSVLTTFKQQLSLMDSILRRTFNDDGTLAGGVDDGMAMAPKDVLNLSLRLSQLMVKELPKIYSMDRVQRMEAALLKVMSEHLSRPQQEAFLAEIEKQQGKM